MNNQFYWGRMPATNIAAAPSVVASQFGDVTGDGFMEWIFLTGTRDPDSAYTTNIQLVVRNGRTNRFQHFPLPENDGYEPAIWLGDLTGNGIKDIFITIQSGGSGAVLFAYVFSFIEGRMMKVFDSIQFSEQHAFEVQYANDYKVNVISRNPGKIYTLDIQYKGQDYLNEIYDPNKMLKQPIDGWVDPISGLYPIPIAHGGQYYLLAIQQIAGRYHADSLGTVENLLRFNGRQFTIVRQTVAIYGEDLNK